MRLRNVLITAAFLVPAFCAVTGFLALAFDPLPIRMMRNAQFDQFQRWLPRAYVDAPVRIVDIDDESLARLGQWPWPRTRMAELVEKLRDAGAAAIGFDIVFAEPDRTSPEAIAKLWQTSGELANVLARLPDHDEVFANALKGSGVVLGFALERGASHAQAGSSTLEPPYRFVQLGSPANEALHPFQGAVMPLPNLAAAAAGRGAIAFVPDGDGVVRRVPLVFELQGRTVPSLAAETLRVGQDARNYILKSATAKGTGLEEIRVGEVAIPTTPQGEVWVHYSEPVPARYIPAWKVLSGAVPRDQLEGRLVLVGTSAQGLKDLRFSPLGRIIPGVEAHAQALEQILAGEGLNRPSWAKAAEAVVLIVGCLVVGFLALAARALMAASVTAICIAALGWAGWYAFSRAGLLLNVIVPAWAIGLTFMLASLIHHFVSERRQRWVKEAFSRYVSPNLVRYLVTHPGELELGGQRRECSFIFTDLANFTSLMEEIDPAQAVALLNTYLDRMIEIAFSHQGTLDRIVGDAVAIMFSAPIPQADHRQRALRCAMEMDKFASAYARELNQKGIPFGMTRIGVHAGEVIVGNFGGVTIFDYRALGDPVNTASRLESVNKHLGTRICVSATILDGSDVLAARPVGRLVLKGKVQALEVLEPIAEDDSRRAPVSEYAEAFRMMKEGDSGRALMAFEALARQFPEDPLVSLHVSRLRAGETDDLVVMNEK